MSAGAFGRAGLLFGTYKEQHEEAPALGCLTVKFHLRIRHVTSLICIAGSDQPNVPVS